MNLQVSIATFVPLILTAFLATQTQAQDVGMFQQQLDFSRSVSEPNWYPYVIARGADRMVIQNTPMACRPYRPMHFYGNAIRRSYFRGIATPMPRDVVRSASTLLMRR